MLKMRTSENCQFWLLYVWRQKGLLLRSAELLIVSFSFTSGFETDHLKAPVWLGGETEALSRLERHLERKAWVASFARPKMTPQSLLPSHTGLSPYLRFGFSFVNASM